MTSAPVPPPSAHLKWEVNEYIAETISFVKREIRYARHMAASFRDGTPGEEVFYSTIAAYLTAAEECLAIAQAPQILAQHEVFRGDMEAFPRIVANATTALLQRKEKQFPRPFSPPVLQAVFAPSEIALEYPLTIRAAEAASLDYHHRVEKFFENFTGCKPPLVNISGGAAANLSLPRVKFTKGKDFSTNMARLLNLSCISLPRWSPQHIRTFGIAGHEHVHRVLQVCEKAMEEASAVAKLERSRPQASDGSAPVSEARPPAGTAGQYEYYLGICDRFKPKYGDEIIDLHKLQIFLSHAIEGFLITNEMPSVTVHKTPRDIDAKVIQAFQKRIALHHANEFIADIGGTLIAGPACLSAFVTIYGFEDAAHVQELRSTEARRIELSEHPPPAVRSLLQIVVLRKLGFIRTARYIFRAIKPALKAAFADADTGPLLRAYAIHLTSRPVKYLIRQLIELFTAVAAAHNPDTMYNLPRRGVKESDLLAEWLLRANRIEDEDLFLTSDLGGVYAADLINAIWEKRRSHGEESPKNRLAWRFALRNVAGGV
jgi:hypothetical protein